MTPTTERIPAQTVNAAPRTPWQAWWPVTMMLGCSLLSYMDRQILAVLSPMILADLKLNAQKYGEIISAFSYAYMVGNPTWGMILDRVGLRRGMTVAVTIWTIACGAHAVLSGFLGFAVARAILGFGEGATFPGGLRTAMDWLPVTQQSRGLAVAYSGGSLGAIITPLIVTPVALAYGWRAAFIVTGVAGFVWVLVWRGTVDFSAESHGTRTQQITLPNLARAPILEPCGSLRRLRTADRRDSLSRAALSFASAAFYAGRTRASPLATAAGMGNRLFFLGLVHGSFRVW